MRDFVHISFSKAWSRLASHSYSVLSDRKNSLSLSRSARTNRNWLFLYAAWHSIFYSTNFTVTKHCRGEWALGILRTLFLYRSHTDAHFSREWLVGDSRRGEADSSRSNGWMPLARNDSSAMLTDAHLTQAFLKSPATVYRMIVRPGIPAGEAGSDTSGNASLGTPSHNSWLIFFCEKIMAGGT